MGNNSVPLCNHKNTGLDNYNQNQNETSFLREEFRNKITIKNIILQQILCHNDSRSQ